ncbi:hypothetical protein MYX78_04820 [Acidobacteria bacterium AH-259-G07]|nr:hypothetical protein [Acidobacteria bacterium AH-259-G07]
MAIPDYPLRCIKCGLSSEESTSAAKQGKSTFKKEASTPIELEELIGPFLTGFLCMLIFDIGLVLLLLGIYYPVHRPFALSTIGVLTISLAVLLVKVGLKSWHVFEFVIAPAILNAVLVYYFWSRP